MSTIRRLKSVKGRDGSVGTSMLDFNFNNLRLHLMEYVAKSLDHRSRKWYRSPEVRQYWDDEQEEIESDWAELFFDLIYVAMAFKLGDLIKEEIGKKEFSFSSSFVFFFGQFLPMYEAWYRRTNYMAKFVGDSLFHKAVDIVENVLVGFMALFIGTGLQIESSLVATAKHIEQKSYSTRELADVPKGFDINILFCFTVVKFVFHLLYILKYFEIRKLTFTGTEKRAKGVQNMTLYALRQQLVALILTIVSSVLAYFGEATLAQITLIGSYFIVSFVFSYISVNVTKKRQFGVPFNVFFFIKRIGEFTMLMLGEGVLQIIILPIGDNVSSHLLDFVFAYLILNGLELIKFYMLPENPNDHVLVKSQWRSPFVLLLYPFFFSALICVGVALKLVLAADDSLQEDDNKNFRITSLLCVSLTFSVFSLILKNLLHKGLYDIMFNTDFNRDPIAKRSVAECRVECTKSNNLRCFRVSFCIVFLVLTFSFLILIDLNLKAKELLGSCCVIIAILFLISVAERKLFKDEFKDSHGHEHKQYGAKELDFLVRPAFEQELWTMNSLWKRVFGHPERAEDYEAREAYDLEIERRKEQLNHMLSFMKAHSNFLQEKIGRTHVEKSNLQKVEMFLNEVRELRELTSLMEENLYFLFSQHASSLPSLIRRQQSQVPSRMSMSFNNTSPFVDTKYSSYFNNTEVERSDSNESLLDDNDSAIADFELQDEERFSPRPNRFETSEPDIPELILEEDNVGGNSSTTEVDSS